MEPSVIPYGIINALLFTPLLFYGIAKVKTFPGIIVFTLVTAQTISASQMVMPIYQEQDAVLWGSYFLTVFFESLCIFLAHFIFVKIHTHIKSSRKPVYTISEDGETIDVALPPPKQFSKIVPILLTVILVLSIAISVWPQSYIIVDVQSERTKISHQRPALCREIIPNSVVIVDQIYHDSAGSYGYVPLKFNIMTFNSPTFVTDKIGSTTWKITPLLVVPNPASVDAYVQAPITIQQYQKL